MSDIIKARNLYGTLRRRSDRHTRCSEYWWWPAATQWQQANYFDKPAGISDNARRFWCLHQDGSL